MRCIRVAEHTRARGLMPSMQGCMAGIVDMSVGADTRFLRQVHARTRARARILRFARFGLDWGSITMDT